MQSRNQMLQVFIQGFVIILLAWLAIRVDDASLCMKTQE